MKTDSEHTTSMVALVLAAVGTRRPQLFNGVGVKTANEEQLIDIIRGLLSEVIDWEDYNRRVEFSLKCMEGDLLGSLRKCRGVREGEPDADGNGFTPATGAIGFGEGDD